VQNRFVDLDRLGLQPEAAVRQVGFRYITTVGSVDVFDGLHRYVSRSLVWSTRSSWRRMVQLSLEPGVSLPFARALAATDCDSSHDREIPMFVAVKSMLHCRLGRREPMSYEKFIANHLDSRDS